MLQYWVHASILHIALGALLQVVFKLIALALLGEHNIVWQYLTTSTEMSV